MGARPVLDGAVAEACNEILTERELLVFRHFFIYGQLIVQP